MNSTDIDMQCETVQVGTNQPTSIAKAINEKDETSQRGRQLAREKPDGEP